MKRGGMDQNHCKKRTQAQALEVVSEVEQKKRRSGRCSGIEIKKIHTVTLGNGEPTSVSYGNNQYTPAEIKDFVEKAIKYDIQKVSLPTTPESHTLVVIKEPGIIRIVDWNNKREPKTEDNEDHEEDKENEEEYYLHSGYEAGKEVLNVHETNRKSMLEGKIQNKEKLTKKEKEEMEEMEEKEKNYIKWRQYAILIDAIHANFPHHEVVFEKVIRELRKEAFIKAKTCGGMGGCSEYVDLWLKKKYCNVLNLQKDEYVFKKME